MNRPTISPSNCDTDRDACPSETTYIRLLSKQSKGLVFAPMGALRLLQYHHVSSVIVQRVSSLFHISGRRLVQSTVWMGSGQTFLAVCWDVTDRIPDFREPFFLFLDHMEIVNTRQIHATPLQVAAAERGWGAPECASTELWFLLRTNRTRSVWMGQKSRWRNRGFGCYSIFCAICRLR
jgi:hypothetical protein